MESSTAKMAATREQICAEVSAPVGDFVVDQRNIPIPGYLFQFAFQMTKYAIMSMTVMTPVTNHWKCAQITAKNYRRKEGGAVHTDMVGTRFSIVSH